MRLKKLTPILMISFMFTSYQSYADQVAVNLDMLTGQWTCIFSTKNSQLSDDGSHFVYTENKAQEPAEIIRFIYTKIDEPDLNLKRISIPKTLTNKYLFTPKKKSEVIYKDKRFVNFEEYKYINDNKFEYITINESFYYDHNQKATSASQSTYMTLLCSKIDRNSPYWVDNIDENN